MTAVTVGKVTPSPRATSPTRRPLAPSTCPMAEERTNIILSCDIVRSTSTQSRAWAGPSTRSI